MSDTRDSEHTPVTMPPQHDHDHGHDHGSTAGWRPWLPALTAFGLLAIGMSLDFLHVAAFQNPWVRLVWYLVAYLPVGLPVLRQALGSLRKGEVFNEFFLMSIATLGAFYLGEYPEGVAVMLFYAVGEAFQHAAVHRAKHSIQALLDVRPATATVVREGQALTVKPATVAVGEILRIRPGERVPLDGVLLGDTAAAFDTAALTGESLPRDTAPGDPVLAGSIAADRAVELRVTKLFANSALARILHLVQHAAKRKAPTEQFIRRFARVYTPIVVGLALAITVLPWFFMADYRFHDWLYRALIFLVISCPCALVISIPLGYFGGIGAASRHGILLKGSNFLDLLPRLNTLVTDKTGTLTRGVFTVQNVSVAPDFLSENELLRLAASLETVSTHPVAKAVVQFVERQKLTLEHPADVEEISGHGLRGQVGGRAVLVGNRKLLEKFSAGGLPSAMDESEAGTVLVAVDGRFAGQLDVADELKPDAAAAIRRLRAAGIRRVVMLSGDRQSVADRISRTLGLDEAFGDLLPADKMAKIETLRRDSTVRLAFVGDGINDAPALALADVGIAMGGLGADAAIETADVVIQTDQPGKIATAIDIGRATRRVVWQNIGLAFGVKFVVMALGAGGLATMWEAVFADVGVALLAILNAVRIQRMQFN